MNILLSFLPFIGFALVNRLIGPVEGLVAGAAIVAVMLLRDFLGGKTPKILEIGAAVLFGGLAAFAFFGSVAISLWIIRLLVDLGLWIIVIASMLLGRPFTLQYARETTNRTVQDSPEFLRANYVITGVWGLAFTVMVAADVMLAYMPGMPAWVGIGMTVGALAAAIKFTTWYPKQM